TPDTILRCYRTLVAKKYGGSHARRPGRPRTKADLVLCENSVQAEYLDNRRIRGNRPMRVAVEVGHLHGAQSRIRRALHLRTVSVHASRLGLAAASARRSAVRRLGQPTATGRH